jgi:tRNA threonylcarbamoyladenosine biosynthesis protein TsaE
MSWPVVVGTSSPAETKDVAARVAQICSPGDVILLVGDLGAGKTAFAQGFAAALGVEGPVTSPTFTLVRQYRCADTGPVETLIHADVYRTGSLPEVVDLALAELVEEQAIALVEWGDLAAPALGEDVLEITLELPGVDGATSAEQRTITVNGRGRWSRRDAEVVRALSGAPAGPGSTQ